MIKTWPCIRSHSRQSFRVFSIRTDTAISPKTGKEHDFYIIESRDWVNIIPLTIDDHVVMVKQYRHGSKEITLEIPGGLVDPDDTPEEAARRELLEETGYRSEEWINLGTVSPNPALFNNHCYTFLAKNVEKISNPKPDQTEDIEVIILPISNISELIQDRKINHAMVITAFYLYFLYNNFK